MPARYQRSPIVEEELFDFFLSIENPFYEENLLAFMDDSVYYPTFVLRKVAGEEGKHYKGIQLGTELYDSLSRGGNGDCVELLSSLICDAILAAQTTDIVIQIADADILLSAGGHSFILRMLRSSLLEKLKDSDPALSGENMRQLRIAFCFGSTRLPKALNRYTHKVNLRFPTYIEVLDLFNNGLDIDIGKMRARRIGLNLELFDETVKQVRLLRASNRHDENPLDSISDSEEVDYGNGIYAVGVANSKGVVQEYSFASYPSSTLAFRFVGRSYPDIERSFGLSLDLITSARKNIERSRRIYFDLCPDQYDIEGRSSSTAVFTALLVHLLDVNVQQKIAITGELKADGRIRGVGQVLNKVVSAYNTGMDCMILPELQREYVLASLPEYIYDELSMVFVNDYRDVMRFFSKESL